jgi:fructose-1,6-bisphosphatase II
MGLGKPDEADREARTAMCAILSTIEMDGRIVAGEEGRRATCDYARAGAQTGTGAGPQVDLVLDPIDGCSLLAQGHPGAISVVAAAPRGAFWSPTGVVYMDKIVVDARVAPFLVPECMDAPAAWTLALVARAKQKKVSDLVVFVLNRPRHADLIKEIRTAGARVMLRSEGDIAGALMSILPDGGIDVLLGTGGIAEGLLAACAVKATGGAMLGRLAPQSADERAAATSEGLDARRILSVDELVTGNETFFAVTGITDGPLMAGIRYHGERATSHSMILRGETHTRRTIRAEHLLGA